MAANISVHNGAPGVVVAGVQAHGVLVAGQPLLKVLVGHVLVSRQRVCVREGGLHLQCTLEEAQRVFMLLHVNRMPLYRH